MLINQVGEVKIRRYDTDFESDACRLLVDDWKLNSMGWEWEPSNIAFSSELLESQFDLLLNAQTPQYENGIRVMEWYSVGDSESDDEIIQTYFICTRE